MSRLRQSAGARFIALFLAGSGGLAALVLLALAMIDPYGLSPLRLPMARPIMDINQRFMYPQLARSGRFDSAVFGTSTLRLLDPDKLNAALGGQFANLAMNAATPWEQLQLARLFLRDARSPRTILLGIDAPWCADDADTPARRITFRAFPERFYDDNIFNDLLQYFNLKSLEIAGRLVAFHLNRATPRIRQDGYENFLPPDADWTQAYADRLLWPNGRQDRTPQSPPFAYTQEQRRALRFPAIGWLSAFAAALPAQTRLLLVLPPNHISAQPVPGTHAAALEAECRTALVGSLGTRALIIDMNFPNTLTKADSLYWDQLHFRLPVADQVLDRIREAADGKNAGPMWRLLR